MAKQNRTDLQALATDTNIIDNTVEAIEPIMVRDQLENERDSAINQIEDGVEAVTVTGGQVLRYTNPPATNDIANDDLITKATAEEIVSNGVTNATLSLGANTLTFTDNEGNTTNLDLSIYLDDSNLSRIVSGTIDNVTNIATFTRDDASTFDIDFSSLNDQTAINTAISDHLAEPNPHTQYYLKSEVDTSQGLQDTAISGNTAQITANNTQITANAGQIATNQTNITTNGNNITTNANDISNNSTNISTNLGNIATNQTAITNLQTEQTTQDNAIALNTAKVSSDGSVGTHSDVDLIGITVAQNYTLKYDGSNFLPCLNNVYYSNALRITELTAFTNIINQSVNVQRIAPHKITISFNYSVNTQQNDIVVQSSFGGLDLVSGISDSNEILRIEPKDAAGPSPDGRGTNQKLSFMRSFWVTPSTLGNNTFSLDYACGLANTSSSIWDITIEIEEYINLNLV